MKAAPVFLIAMAAASLAACSSTSQNATGSLPASLSPQARADALRGVILPSGVDTRYAGSHGVSQSAIAPARRHKRLEKDFFVADGSSNLFTLSNKTDKVLRTITGLNEPDGVWVDKKGNVYVAMANGASVLEYKKGKGSPICTYSSGIIDPINVTTDSAGNVYVDDFNLLRTPGYIDVFPQCSNTMSKQYDIDSGPEGVAVDKSGDIFVLYFGSSGGSFEEFKGGSSTPTPLGATVTSPGGLLIDKKGNLVADDQSGSIDIIAPPYSSAAVLVSGLSDPFHDSLNSKENKLYNANNGSATVTIYKYPSGSLITTVGTSNGIDGAEGVGESPNAVF